MISLVIDLNEASGRSDFTPDEICTEVDVNDNFANDVQNELDDRLEEVENVSPRFEYQDLLKKSWDEGDTEEVKARVTEIVGDLNERQTASKRLLYYADDSTAVLSHYHETKGWVQSDTGMVHGERFDADSTINTFVLRTRGAAVMGSKSTSAINLDRSISKKVWIFLPKNH
jgi:hypothetical protein